MVAIYNYKQIHLNNYVAILLLILIMRITKTLTRELLLTVIVVAFFVGCNTLRPVANTNNTLNGHEYVDLGLPSGTLWAACNVGAKNPEDYGQYFAWGETEPKKYYNEENYKYMKGKPGRYTKYCYKPEHGYNGFSDKLTTLEAVDDVAAVKWGSGWRMPTKEESAELLKYTTKKVETVHKVKGMRLIGPNGNSIFLPAAGNIVDGKLLHDGNDCVFWTSSLNKVISTAWVFYCSCKSNSWDTFDMNFRNVGKSVRPVCSTKK